MKPELSIKSTQPGNGENMEYVRNTGKAKINRPQVSKERFTIDDMIYTIVSRMKTKGFFAVTTLAILGYVYVEFGYRFISFVVSR